jgi:tetratricopeptide (TPR) repeat protein
MKRRIFLLLFTAIIASAATSGCAERKATLVSASPNLAAESRLSTGDERVRQAESMIEKMPGSAAGYINLATAYIQTARETGDFSLNSKAEAAIRRAREIEPENASAQKLEASLHLTFHRFADALEAGKKLQKNYPKDAFVYGVLTDANVELGNYAEAVEAAQTMVDLKPGMESYARVSQLRFLHGDANGAIEAMTLAARAADPQNREARGWCLVHLGDEYFKTGKFAEAEKHYDEALRIFPNYHLALAAKAKARAALGDYEAAIRLYNAAQNRVPLVETVIALGDLYVKTGEAEKAARQYDLAEIMEREFGNTDLRRLALLWADRDLRPDEALTIAAQENANRSDIFTADVYAWCLYRKGKFQEARAAISKAMRLKTKDARIFYHAGMIEKALGNEKEAARHLQAALQANPAFDLLQADNARKALAELR